MVGQEENERRRGRGHRAGIDLAGIIASARKHGARGLTMQAVADDLGVDRKTINHYVGDRETLIRMAALSAFAQRANACHIPTTATWQEATRTLIVAFVDGMIAAGEFAQHIRLDSEFAGHLIEPTERLVERLAADRFTTEDAVRFLAQISNLVTAYAHDVISSGRRGRLERPDLLREGLAAHSAANYPLLTQIAAAGVDTYDRRQLNLTIDTFIAGTEALHEGEPEIHSANQT